MLLTSRIGHCRPKARRKVKRVFGKQKTSQTEINMLWNSLLKQNVWADACKSAKEQYKENGGDGSFLCFRGQQEAGYKFGCFKIMNKKRTVKDVATVLPGCKIQ